MENVEYLKIPKARIPVLIGENGAVKEEIEKSIGVRIDVDSAEGQIKITNIGEDVLAAWTGRDIVKAIGKGMNPRKAMKLKNEDYYLEIINLNDFVRTPKELKRQKARIIGSEGKTRKHIENSTDTHISVFGKSVVVIGQAEELGVAKEAVFMLLEGKPHGVVYKILEKKSREIKEKRMTSLWK